MPRAALLEFSDDIQLASGVSAVTSQAGRVCVQMVNDRDEIFAMAAMPPAAALQLIEQITEACIAMSADGTGAPAGRA